MNQRRLRAALRAVAIVEGLFEVVSVFFGIHFLGVAIFGKDGSNLFPVNVLIVMMGLFFLIPGFYLCRVVFLVWRRFSPRAVLDLCGGIAFLVSITIGSFDRFGPVWSGAALGFWMVVVHFGYRLLSRYLVRRLFEPGVLASTPQAV